MADWVVLEPPVDAKPGDPVFVRDDFRWMAFLVPPLWLMWHRLWPEALIAMAVLFAINGLAASGAVAPSIGLLSTLVSLFAGLEGPAMRIASLRRKGYTEAAALSAGNLDEAELRYGEGLDGAEAETSLWEPPPIPASAIPRPNAPALGMFSYPGRS